MAVSSPSGGEWVQGTALEAVIPPARIFGGLDYCFFFGIEQYICSAMFTSLDNLSTRKYL